MLDYSEGDSSSTRSESGGSAEPQDTQRTKTGESLANLGAAAQFAAASRNAADNDSNDTTTTGSDAQSDQDSVIDDTDLDWDNDPRLPSVQIIAYEIAQALYEDAQYRDSDSLLVATTAERLDFPELLGVEAYRQVAIMNHRWLALSARDAQNLAAHGRLVAVGGPFGTGDWHVAIVVPGPGVTINGDFYPNVIAGLSRVARTGDSDGTQTVADLWDDGDWESLHYFTPQRGYAPGTSGLGGFWNWVKSLFT